MPSSITMVEPIRRSLSSLPNEILRIIIWNALGSVAGRVITAKYGQLLEMNDMFDILCNLLRVSKHFNELTKSVFYGLNLFSFPIDDKERRRHITSLGNVRSPFLPPQWALGSLRRIHLEVGLTDSYLVSSRIRYDENGRDYPQRHPVYFQSVDELYRYCAGARVLRLISDYMPELTILDLHIFEDFRSQNIRRGLDLYRRARFTPRARWVRLRINNLHFPGPQSKNWYPELRSAIGF
jgi:hypothetical protein